ncbi:MAG: 1,4-dihydroxy-2-naphthoate polyprenyltransferase [Agromyces sp.]
MSKSRRPQAPARTPHPRATKRVHHSPVVRATTRDWIAGARLRTLPLAIAPVALGTGIGIFEGGTMPWRPVNAVLALLVGLCLQIGVNFANDYSDGIRGTDAYRVGPKRLTGSGAAQPARVRSVAFAFFGLAALAGLVLVILTQFWWLLAVGVLAIAAAWFYTGGKRPYGYAGLGEVVVFLFFGLVATVGSAWVQSDIWLSQPALVAGSGVGLLACAVLMANNLRDIEQDALAGKRTLAVRLGSLGSRIVFALFMLLPFGALWFLSLTIPAAGIAYFVLLMAIPAAVIVLWSRTAQELIWALQLASFSALAYGLSVGLAFAFA